MLNFDITALDILHSYHTERSNRVRYVVKLLNDTDQKYRLASLCLDIMEYMQTNHDLHEIVYRNVETFFGDLSHELRVRFYNSMIMNEAFRSAFSKVSAGINNSILNTCGYDEQHKDDKGNLILLPGFEHKGWTSSHTLENLLANDRPTFVP
jgi:hypothetical protein